MTNKYCYFPATLAIVLCLSLSGCESECTCESIPAEIIIQDENGDPLEADEVIYTVDDVEMEVSEIQLQQPTITLDGPVPGTYHI